MRGLGLTYLYTLLCIEIIKKVLLHNIGSYSQYSVTTYVGKESEKE